jgi:uncharacterized Ntn-hydrolase superfamily protein
VTFSLLGLDETGHVGAVVSSSSPAVGARCIYVRAGVGASLSQNVTDPRLGTRLLDLIAEGRRPASAIGEIVGSESVIAYRQLAALDRGGRTAVFSGEKTLGCHAAAEAPGAVAAGNLLDRTDVPAAMVEAFAASTGELGDRLVAALSAGLEAGGEEGPVRSAGLLVAGEVSWPLADLRVDWSDDPVGGLAELWTLWKPQMNDYLARALDPEAAPGFGVAGEAR